MRLNDKTPKKKNIIEMLLSRRSFVAAAAVVVFVTTYMLILPAVTQSANAYCGHEEHKHDDNCYTVTKELICGKEESEGHTHTDACYTTEQVLTCGQEESEEHTHTDACYTEQKTLTCGQEESEGHKHTDACYKEEKTLTCTKEEHEHTLQCFSNPNADVETAADWESTLSGVQLTGIRSDDLINVAESQMGYHESTENYLVDENNNMKGYTRYGAWYGNEYGDWDAMFASFCYNYAGIDTSVMPEESSCGNWITMLNNKGLYHSASGDYEVKAGDLVFFNADSESCHVGIVVEVTKSGNQISNIKVIEGDCSDQVQKNSYSIDSSISGYGELKDNKEDAEETASDEKEEKAKDQKKKEKATKEKTEEATTDVDKANDAAEVTTEDLEKEDSTEAATDNKTEMTEPVLVDYSTEAVIYTDSYYKDLSDDQTIITVSGKLPENALVKAYPAYVDESDFKNGTTVIRAYDITIFDSEGNTFEPEEGKKISVNFEIPGLKDFVDVNSVSVYYVPVEGEPEKISAKIDNGEVTFDAEHFSTYTVTADPTNNTITVNDVTYTALPNPTQTVTTTNGDKVIMKDTGSFTYKLDFTLDNTQTTDRYFMQLPQYAVLQEIENEPIKDTSGNTLATYTITNVDADGDGVADTSYILITPTTASTKMDGSISAKGTGTKEGTITFSDGSYINVIPSDSNYDSLQTSKSTTSQTKNEDGSYTFTHTITIKNKGNTPINNLWFVDEARTTINGTYNLTITGPVSTDSGAPVFTKVTDTSDTNIYKSGYEYYSIGSADNPVTIPANTTYTYTATSTISAEDFAVLEAGTTSPSSSDSIVTVYDDTRLDTTTTWFNYYPSSLVMSKKALTANVTDDSTVIPWEITFNTNSRLNTQNAVITDTIKENAYATDDSGIHFMTDYPVTATIEYYGNAQTTIELTWVEVDDLNNIENPDGEHIYYHGNSFKYFPYLYSGWSQNYGVVLKYYTNYNKQISPTANEAQSNFVDVNGTTGKEGAEVDVKTGGEFDNRVQLNKMLDSQNEDNTATWTVTSSINSTSNLTTYFLDSMPYKDHSDTSTFEKLVNDAKIYSNDQVDKDSNAAYILFDSVAQFEAVTGITVTVTDRVTGAVLDKEAILCGGNVSYTNEWSHTWDETDAKKLLFVYDTRTVSNSSHYDSFMIVPNVPSSSAATYMNTANYKGAIVGGFLPSNSRAGTEEGYNITFTYSTDTSGASDGETRRNTVKQNGTDTGTRDSFDLSAQAYYIKSGDASVQQIDKNIARAVLQDDGSYKLTYVVLLDNRGNNSEKINTLQWKDAISGIDGAEYVEGSLDVYIPKVEYDSGNSAWNITTYSSLDEIETDSQTGYPVKIISDSDYVNYDDENGFGSGRNYDLTQLITYNEGTNGFNFTMNLRKLLNGWATTYQKQNYIVRNYVNSKTFCWQSFYLVYDVTVPASKVSSGTLTNKITRYVDGTADLSASNEYSMGMKELEKKETQRADNSNNYYTKYELDVTMSEQLKNLESFTVQDSMSDSLNMNVNSMVVTSTTGDTTTTLTSSDYTVRYANGALTLVFNKPTAGWPDSYKITYGATVIGEGPVKYSNSAVIPEIGSVPQYTESSTYIKDEEISAKQVTLNIQKYDGDNISGGGLDGAEFVLERLTNEAQQTLLTQGITSEDAMDDYLSSLPDSSWTKTNVPQPQATGTAGEFTLTSSTEEAIYSNVVYRLRETKAPEGFVFDNVHRYFMIYSNTADATQTGITAKQAYKYIYPYVDQKNYVISYQIPNYQVNFNVYKTNTDGDDLTGAEFTLYQDKDCTKVLKKGIPTKDEDGRTCYNFPKLSVGTTYYVKETKQPDTYDLNDAVVKVTIAEDGTVTFTNVNGSALIKETDAIYVKGTTMLYQSTDDKLTYVDKLTTYDLPKTGGIGTTPFTIVGILLMAGAVFTAVLKCKVKTGKM